MRLGRTKSLTALDLSLTVGELIPANWVLGFDCVERGEELFLWRHISQSMSRNENFVV